MKDEDVRIGMKVTVKGVEDVCIVVYEKDYKTKNGNVYTLQNEKTGKKMTLNACDFEPYIDTDLISEQLIKAIDNIKDTLSQQLRLEKEIREAFGEYTNKVCSYSLQACFRAGFLAGRESK